MIKLDANSDWEIILVAESMAITIITNITTIATIATIAAIASIIGRILIILGIGLISEQTTKIQK